MNGLSWRARIALAALALLGCRSAPPSWAPRWDRPYASFDASQREGLRRTRRLMERGEWEAAHAEISALHLADEENIELGSLLQDIELELLDRGSDADPELALLALETSPEEALRRRWAAFAELAPTPAGLVLAARAESDALAAGNLLDRALELGPRCAYAHYGKAHALLQATSRTQRWRLARESLDRALEIDPSLLPARRLEAWILTQEGANERARAALVAWLEAAEYDPRVSTRERVQAQLDLAAIQVVEGRARLARELLGALEGEPIGRGRRLATLAAAEQALGNPEAALDAARRAEGAMRDTMLPLVQQAILYRFYLGDRSAAEERWVRVQKEARGQADLATVLQAVRARVMLERGGAGGT